MCSKTTLDIAILAYDGANAVDVFGPLQVFTSANAVMKKLKPDDNIVYNPRLISLSQPIITLSTHTEVVSNGLFHELIEAGVDTLLIAGGDVASDIAKQPKLIRQLTTIMGGTRRCASVCSGAFILAATGLLARRRATTHWNRYDEFKVCYPDIELVIDALFTQDGKYYCSAGVTAGIDLALHLVQEDCGRRVALETARELVTFYHRPGGQNQFSAVSGMSEARSDSMKHIQRWIASHIDQVLDVSQLADIAAMSVRHFSRKFRDEIGLSPSRYIAQLRLNKARLLLEESTHSITRVASQCGYQNSEIMRRLFIRELNVSPTDYRKRFHITSISSDRELA